MFGITVEKLVVIGVIAGVIIGPRRLPAYVERLAALARKLKAMFDTAKLRTEDELGVSVNVARMREEMQRYDPRRIVRDALTGSGTSTSSSAGVPGDQSRMDQTPMSGNESVPTDISSASRVDMAHEVRRRWVVSGGSSGHPRRRLVTEVVPSSQSNAFPLGNRST